jgi:DNA-binding response OmpR family regulator
MRFLVVEDNERLADTLKLALEEQGYTVDTTTSGRKGEEMAAKGSYDVIILDLMLPDHDGVQICRNLRRRGISKPVLMLTALSSTDEKVSGLEAGADDYLTKPIDLDEFIARVRALLRRAQSTEGATLSFGGVELDLVGRKVMRDGKRIELTTKEFALLEYFMRNPERVLTRTNIGERVWDLLFPEESNVIEVYVSRLRSKIDKGFEQRLIHTVVGTGYTMSTERNVGAPAD